MVIMGLCPLLLLCIFLAHCTATYDVYVSHWQRLPDDSPPSICTQHALDTIHQFVAPIMLGGLGNMLFQLAAAHSVAEELHRPCVVAWWNQHVHGEYVYRPPFGHRNPADNITLKHIFPYLPHYVDFDPLPRNVDAIAVPFTRFPEGVAVADARPLKPMITRDQAFTLGYFMHPIRLCVSQDVK